MSPPHILQQMAYPVTVRVCMPQLLLGTSEQPARGVFQCFTVTRCSSAPDRLHKTNVFLNSCQGNQLPPGKCFWIQNCSHVRQSWLLSQQFESQVTNPFYSLSVQLVKDFKWLEVEIEYIFYASSFS